MFFILLVMVCQLSVQAIKLHVLDAFDFNLNQQYDFKFPIFLLGVVAR